MSLKCRGGDVSADMDLCAGVLQGLGVEVGQEGAG